MKTLEQYEKQILKEIQGLPVSFQKKGAGMVKFLKAHVFYGRTDEIKATEQFLSVCGKWEDQRSIGEQLEEIYSSRKPSQNFSPYALRGAP